MEILESLRYALRSRIIPGIVPITDFQRQGADAPGVPLYVRETIIEASAESFSRNAEKRLATAYCKEAGSSAITPQPAERAFRRWITSPYDGGRNFLFFRYLPDIKKTSSAVRMMVS